jgi:hypothetical protein
MPDFDPVNNHPQYSRSPSRITNPGGPAPMTTIVYVQGLLGAGVNGYHLKDQPLSDLKLAIQRVLAGEVGYQAL